MYIAVCDDMAEERERITELLEQWQQERNVSLRYHAYSCAADMLDAAPRERFSLYLLDVMMPGTNGIDAAREIRCFDDAADIVFLTTSPGFAYESYGVHALDYLLKPIGAELLFPILDKISQREKSPREGLVLKSGSTLIRVPFSQLTYVEVSGKHLYFNMNDGTVKEVAGSLNEYEGGAAGAAGVYADTPQLYCEHAAGGGAFPRRAHHLFRQKPAGVQAAVSAAAEGLYEAAV